MKTDNIKMYLIQNSNKNYSIISMIINYTIMTRIINKKKVNKLLLIMIHGTNK